MILINESTKAVKCESGYTTDWHLDDKFTVAAPGCKMATWGEGNRRMTIQGPWVNIITISGTRRFEQEHRGTKKVSKLKVVKGSLVTVNGRQDWHTGFPEKLPSTFVLVRHCLICRHCATLMAKFGIPKILWGLKKKR